MRALECGLIFQGTLKAMTIHGGHGVAEHHMDVLERPQKEQLHLINYGLINTIAERKYALL